MSETGADSGARVRRRDLALAVGMVLVVLTGCGGGSGSPGVSVSTPETSEHVTTTTDEAPASSVPDETTGPPSSSLAADSCEAAAQVAFERTEEEFAWLPGKPATPGDAVADGWLPVCSPPWAVFSYPIAPTQGMFLVLDASGGSWRVVGEIAEAAGARQELAQFGLPPEVIVALVGPLPSAYATVDEARAAVDAYLLHGDAGALLPGMEAELAEVVDLYSDSYAWGAGECSPGNVRETLFNCRWFLENEYAVAAVIEVVFGGGDPEWTVSSIKVTLS